MAKGISMKSAYLIASCSCWINRIVACGYLVLLGTSVIYFLECAYLSKLYLRRNMLISVLTLFAYMPHTFLLLTHDSHSVFFVWCLNHIIA